MITYFNLRGKFTCTWIFSIFSFKIVHVHVHVSQSNVLYHFFKNFLQTVYYFFYTRLEKEQELCFPVENKNDNSCVPSPDGWRRQKNCLRRQRPVKQTPSIKRRQHYIRSLSITSIRVKIICPCKLVVLIMLMLCTLWKATVRISSLLQHCSIIP